MTRNEYRSLVEAEYCKDHRGAGGQPCGMARKAADAALAVLEANHWPFADLDNLREITDVGRKPTAPSTVDGPPDPGVAPDTEAPTR